MTQDNPQVPWSDEQWARVSQTIQEEASRARVAATFLPLYGPLPPDADFVRDQQIVQAAPGMTIDDRGIIQLATLQVKVSMRGAQMADPEMRSALALFRRAANVLARLEDAMIFNGQQNTNQGPRHGAPTQVWEVSGGGQSEGLFDRASHRVSVAGNDLVAAVSRAIGMLEGRGQFGPFAVVLGQGFFNAVQTPLPGSMVLPQDRIIPFLGGGSLLRSSTLRDDNGVVVALGGAPVELVIATDLSLQFLQLTATPDFLFRLYEKMVLRIKEPDAIVRLSPAAGTSTQGATRSRARTAALTRRSRRGG
jgi:uncharacterized linocin/CFP29 family protein